LLAKEYRLQVRRGWRQSVGGVGAINQTCTGSRKDKCDNLGNTSARGLFSTQYTDEFERLTVREKGSSCL